MKHAIEVQYVEGGTVTYYANSLASADDFVERVMESGPAALSAVVRPANESEMSQLEESDDLPVDSQCGQVLAYLKRNGSITAWIAIQEFQITQLAARICELKARGYKIESSMTKSASGKRHAVYRLNKETNV